MPTISLKDKVVHYRFDETAGPQRPVLIFSNSLGTDLSMWDAQVAALAMKYRILRYDTRGHGKSTCHESSLSISALGQDVIDLMDVLQIPTASFCGLSMGGMIGTYLAINAQARFEKFILSNTNAFTAHPDFWQKRIETLLYDGGIATIADGVMARFFSPEFTAKSPSVVLGFKQQMLSTDLAGYVACCSAIRDMDFREGLSEIQTPTMVISGKKDQASPPENGIYLSNGIFKSRYLELDAAHISNVELPEQFSKAIEEFLG